MIFPNGTGIAIQYVAVKSIYQIFFSECPRMNKIKTVIDEIAKVDVNVLIQGESGTGKELVAQAIHLNSHRQERPFVKVNCAAIPKGLLESELFGYERGAFTGANIRRPGKFELANGGTILLNEIGEVDISVQAKLLQVLQDGEFSRLGGEENVSVNARVITTTADHLEKSVREGRFREDLFYRINVMSIAVPPLRDRKEQILPLSEYFLNLYTAKYGRAVPPLSLRTIKVFQEYQWPGNIRELENVIKRIVLFGEEETISQEFVRELVETADSLESFKSSSDNAAQQDNPFNLTRVGKRAAQIAERKLIQNILQETHWNRKEAARLLHVSYKALLYKIEKYGLDQEGLQRIGGR